MLEHNNTVIKLSRRKSDFLLRSNNIIKCQRKNVFILSSLVFNKFPGYIKLIGMNSTFLSYTKEGFGFYFVTEFLTELSYVIMKQKTCFVMYCDYNQDTVFSSSGVIMRRSFSRCKCTYVYLSHQ
jgi:hypothetical protein